MYSRMLLGSACLILVSGCSNYKLRPYAIEISGAERGVYTGVAGSDYTKVMIAQHTGRVVCGTLPRKLVVTPQEDGTKSFQGKC